jgi:8-oxo-dGTP pyrophosphatase MutT (NUDIX family)
MDFHSGIEFIRSSMQLPLPGEEAQYRMAPMQRRSKSEYLSEKPDPRLSSVLILLYPGHANRLSTMLIKRPENQGAHSGQIAFPGGKVEPGEDLADTALRETFEEVGVHPDKITLIGPLTSLYIPVSSFLVHPFIGVYPEEPVFNPNPDEVSALVPASVKELLEMKTGTMEVTTSYGKLNTPYFDLYGHVIWGATAMIISEFRELMQRAGDGS